MITLGKDKWPRWVKKAIGNRTGIEIKENRGHYYCYETKGVWDKKLKVPKRTSKYLGVVTKHGLKHANEVELKGIYEYGNVEFAMRVMEDFKILKYMQEVFPEWKTILAFAINRLIDPRPIKSMQSWYEKTYLVKSLRAPFSPKTISASLERIGGSMRSQLDFFEKLKQDDEKLIYDGSVIFSESKENPLLEFGYNKDNFLLTKANIVLAFSHERFVPIFFRILPGSIHEIASLDVLLDELGEKIILVMDKGFSSEDKFDDIVKKGVSFIVPLKRNSKLIDYNKKFSSFFMYRKRPIKSVMYKNGKFFIYLFEDLSLKIEEEKTYYTFLSQHKNVDFKEHWAGKIALISNIHFDAQKIYEMWKTRDEVEKAFDVLQNTLDTDKPYVRKENIFRGYIFASFIALMMYYLVLKRLKEAEINNKISVADAMLELSKIYVLDINGREIISERSKRARSLMKSLKIESIVTKTLRS